MLCDIVLGCLVSYLTSLFIKRTDKHLLSFLKFEAIISILIAMVVSIDQIFYRDKPKHPPSLSQWLQNKSMEVIQGNSKQNYSLYKNQFIQVITNFNFHYFAILIAIYQGLIIGWTGILDTILGPNDMGYSQKFVALIGIIIFATFMLSIVGIAYVNDTLFRKVSFKIFIVILTFASGVFLSLFVVIADDQIHERVIDLQSDTSENDTDLLYAIIFCMLAIFFNAGTYGLSYEEGCNLLYPCREIIAGTIITVYINIVSCIFILMNSYISPQISNGIVAGSQIICAILLACYQQKYDRTQLDKHQDSYHNPSGSMVMISPTTFSINN